MRAAKTQYTKSLGRADRQHRQEELELRKEVDVQTKMVRELEPDKEAGEKWIRELEAGTVVGQRRIHDLEAGATGDEWTRDCEKVWEHLYKAVAKGFHPDKTGGDSNQAKFETFFKVAGDKNDSFNGKGPQSSTEMTAREERDVVAGVECEKREGL